MIIQQKFLITQMVNLKRMKKMLQQKTMKNQLPNLETGMMKKFTTLPINDLVSYGPKLSLPHYNDQTKLEFFLNFFQQEYIKTCIL